MKGGLSDTQQSSSIDPFSVLPNELFQAVLDFLELDEVLCIWPFICKKFLELCSTMCYPSSYSVKKWNANEPICKFLIESRKIENRLYLWRNIKTFKTVIPIQSKLSIHAFAITPSEIDISHLRSLIATPVFDPTTSSTSYRESLESILSKVSSSFQALLLREFPIDKALIDFIAKLNLKILHFEYCHFETGKEIDFCNLTSLTKFVIKLEKNFIGKIILPSEIEEFLLYCPQSIQMGNKVTQLNSELSTKLHYM
jgi:hypothetical protein